jgi:hypothetical protein
MSDRPVARPVPARDSTTQEDGDNMYALSRARTQDPSVQVAGTHAIDIAVARTSYCNITPSVIRNVVTIVTWRVYCDTIESQKIAEETGGHERKFGTTQTYSAADKTV